MVEYSGGGDPEAHEFPPYHLIAEEPAHHTVAKGDAEEPVHHTLHEHNTLLFSKWCHRSWFEM